MNTVIIELDTDQLSTGFIPVTKVDEKGRRRGQMALTDVADLLNEVFQWEAAGRKVSMVSRFSQTELIAFGANGPKWQAVKEIQPADYFLVSATGKAYKVGLPRLVVFAGSHIRWPRLFWTADEVLTPESRLFPLIIGNTYTDGRVCTGNTGLKCKTPDDIDRYVRQLIEAPASHTVTKDTDKLYRALSRQWAPGIGRKHAITVKQLLAAAERTEMWG